MNYLPPSDPPGFLLLSKCFLSPSSSEDFNPIKYKSPAVPKPARLVPPYNGFGSEEDSLSFCWGLLPKRPQKDFRKFMEKDRSDETFNCDIQCVCISVRSQL